MKSSSSDLERMINKAAVEAARMGSQAQQTAKRVFEQMSSDVGDSKGYDLPAIDLLETNDELIALIGLPDVAKDTIDLRVTEEGMVVSAKTTPRDLKYLRRETSPKGFKREIKLPEEVKPEQVKATYENGILEVRLPKLVVINAQRVAVE
ncbi:MAG: Hsp20/alpha crystallin family protein [Methanotrichaceae archaeon]|nr:Hsp20/alpha crystallin family protein [Methanotrichaceae archaeon]